MDLPTPPSLIPPPPPTVSIERGLLVVLLAGLAIGCLYVMRPFLSSVLWAAILVFTTWPVHEWLRRKLRLGHTPAAALMVLVVAVLVLLPLAVALPTGADDAAGARAAVDRLFAAGLPTAPDWVGSVPMIGATLRDQWNGWAADLSAMVDFFRPYFGMAAEFGLSLLLGLASGVLQFLLALLIAFFLWASGDRLVPAVTALMRRIAGPRGERLVDVTGLIVRGTVYGILGTALVQGILTGLGLWAAGVPRAALLGVLAGCLSVLPIGAPVVWIPASLFLVAQGQTWTGIILFAYGFAIISGSDNVIRPYFIARGAKLPFLLTMLGVLGGAIAFGLLGVFVGPVLLGVGWTLMAEWAAER